MQRGIMYPPGLPPEAITDAHRDNLGHAIDARMPRLDIARRAYLRFPEECRKALPDLRPEIVTRIFNYFGDESDEEIKDLWARLLAEEITHPGLISLRALRALHEMTGEEARLLKKYSPIIISGIFPNDQLNSLSPSEELSRDYQVLNDAGLIDWINCGAAFNLDPGERREYETSTGICDI